MDGGARASVSPIFHKMSVSLFGLLVLYAWLTGPAIFDTPKHL